jgi:asparagine synthase (glutamine-hydrolysing)
MCGIVGKIAFRAEASPTSDEIRTMLQSISHRGPDGQGVYLRESIGLGHARLAIIDLNTGSQPMANEDETIWIVFNGEIYNYQELREDLLERGHVFRSKTDTEVIVHLYEEYGIVCVTRLRGMFAFAIWDSARNRLFLSRDRVGIKPLYYAQTKSGLFFASEFKALLATGQVPRQVNSSAFRKFLSFYYLPANETPLSAVFKLLPGHSMVVENGSTRHIKFWDLEFTTTRHQLTFEAAKAELHALLQESVGQHMIADVPVGVLLSGGMDSSALLSFAVNATNKRVSTFTVGFSGRDVIDERPFAAIAAKRFGSSHHDISISAEDFWNFLPAYIWHMEEPVHEPPAVALFYISRFARNFVKVLISGEGGDEAFGGYPNYPNTLRLRRLKLY